MRKLVCATVSAALCLMSVKPALAQDYRFAGFDAPRGATAAVNLRVPIGDRGARRASYGLTVGYGHIVGAPGYDGRTTTRAVTLSDIRFSGGDLKQARLASFDLADSDRQRRMNLAGGGISTTLMLVGLIAVGVGVCLVAECFDDDDEAMPN